MRQMVKRRATALLFTIYSTLLRTRQIDGIICKQELTPGSYCHLKFPPIREDTLGTEHPVLKDPNSGDIIHFYGP
jgi:hypothetical protein